MGYQVSYPGWIIKLYLNFTHQIFSHAKNVKTQKAVTSWIFMDFPMLQFFPMVLYNSWFKIFQSKMRTFFLSEEILCKHASSNYLRKFERFDSAFIYLYCAAVAAEWLAK